MYEKRNNTFYICVVVSWNVRSTRLSDEHKQIDNVGRNGSAVVHRRNHSNCFLVFCYMGKQLKRVINQNADDWVCFGLKFNLNKFAIHSDFL